MNYVINLYVSEIKGINRTIVVNDNISVQLFVKSLILSMNGSTRNLYLLEKSGDVVEFDDSDDLSMLNLKVGDIYTIEYNYDDKLWNLEFVVLEKNDGLNIKKIEILDGQGYGICQSEDMLFINELIYTKNKKWRENILDYYKTLNKYFNLKFLLDEVSKLIDDYGKLYEDMYSPKSIVMNVSLNGFDKEIKRKLEKYIENINIWREKSKYLPLDELIWSIYIETGFYNYVSLMPNGVLRASNLKLLFEKAKQYEKTSFKGLYNFISFIDKLEMSSRRYVRC